MKVKNDKEKNNFFIQDINNNDKSFTYKIFKYFYVLFLNKKSFKPILKCILIIIEGIQLISYAFSSVHFNSWKVSTKSLKIISSILSGFRLSLLMSFLKYQIFYIIVELLLIIVFIICLTVILNIIFIESNSKLCQFSMSIIRPLIDIISIVLYIPMTEIMLMPIKCVNGKIYGIADDQACSAIMHLIIVILGVLGAVLLFIWCFFMLFFSFYPFQNPLSSIRVTSYNDLIILVMKLFLVLQYLLITNEYLSLVLLLVISIFIFFICYNESSYNNSKIEISINMRNLLIVWTYCVLLVSKIFENIGSNGLIYLLIIGYPIMIFLSFIIIEEKDLLTIKIMGNNKTLNDYIKKAKTNIRLFNSFVETNKHMRNENENQRDIIVLRGNIKIHCKRCLEKDCPLTKFVNNEGNFNVQRQCLLNYMNGFFNGGLKIYPNSFYLIILFMHFNYSKRFNLNSVRTNLMKLKKIQCSIKEKFIIYCIEQNMKNKDNGYDFNLESDQDNDSQVDLIEQKYQKLKYLIENSIKLYGEFWGIFTTNISSKINTNKLYSLGEKLNIYLNEMNNLWDNELKNKKIGNECQNIIQLYSKFLQEILWDQKKSKEVYNKLNDENKNNYNLNDNKKSKEENNNAVNLDQLTDNQDFLLVCDSDEKGNCKIIQSSSSFAHLIGFQKKDIIGKSIDIIYPNILVEEHCKFIEESISLLHNGQENQKDMSFQENDSNKNAQLIIIKNRMGYISPLMASFKVIDDNDYSDSFLVKIKMENKQAKSEYAYSILTNTDFVIENISSSAINLGLFLDLLKKYVVKMDVLVRTDDDKKIILYEKYNEYEEEPKPVTWVFPDIIYPKDNIQQIKDDEIDGLIEKSSKEKYNLQISSIRFNENENIAFLFKFTEIPLKNNKKKINLVKCIPKAENNLIMFDLYKMHYVRTLVVEKKSGFRNLRNEEEIKEKMDFDSIKIKSNKNPKKRKKNSSIEEEDSSANSDNNNNILLTKERILELQVHNYIEIRNFIFSLPLYGGDVALERFRPNRDKYSASKITESLIKIHVSDFCKRIDETVPSLKNKKFNNKHISESNHHIESQKSVNAGDYLYSAPDSNVSSSQKPIQNEEMNKGLSSDSSSTLATIFQANTIKFIKVLINFSFFGTFVMLLIEFIITYNHIGKLKKKIEFLHNSYTILSNMLYTKHFVTEGVIALAMKEQNMTYKPITFYGNGNIENYLKYLANQLALNRQEFTEKYDSFTSKELCKNYTNFVEKTKMYLTTLTVNYEEHVELLFNSAMSRISSSVNDIVSNPNLMHMKNRNTFELMENLLNEYYINWQKVIEILYDDSIKATELYIPLLVIVICYFVVSIIIIIAFLKLLSIFSLEREKPINLFLTLKKVVFENLKNAAENFSNKLLNKFFGNEDVEEESQQDYQSNIQAKDINIAKFKAANEYNSSIKKGFYYMRSLMIVTIFLVFNFCYFIIKYFDFRGRMENINEFISLYDKTFAAQTYFILWLDVYKSYSFNKSIPMLNSTDNMALVLKKFVLITEQFGESLYYITTKSSFLSGDLERFQKYLLGDCNDLLNDDLKISNYTNISSFLKHGIKPIEMKVFETIRYYDIIYCNVGDNCVDYYSDDMNAILFQDDDKLVILNVLNESVNRKWFEIVLNIIIESFVNYESKSKLNYIIAFVCLIVIIILYYSIIWKMNEQKLIVILKGSADLINLIPQEIKNIIIEKLNE